MTSRVGVRVGVGRASLDVKRQATSDGSERGGSDDLGSVTMSHVALGIRGLIGAGRRLCGYGFEFPFSAPGAVFFELQFAGVGNGSQPPLAAETVFLFTPAAGIRVHF